MLPAQAGGQRSRAAAARVWVFWAHQRPGSPGCKRASRPGSRETATPFVFLGHGSSRPLHGYFGAPGGGRRWLARERRNFLAPFLAPKSSAFISCASFPAHPSSVPNPSPPNLVKDRRRCGELGVRRAVVGDRRAWSSFLVAGSA